MAVKTILEQLEEVQTAISAVMNGQEVVVNGKRHTLANLDALGRRETRLMAKYNRQQGRGSRFNTGLMRRT